MLSVVGVDFVFNYLEELLLLDNLVHSSKVVHRGEVYTLLVDDQI